MRSAAATESAADATPSIAVLDFRRRGMLLGWRPADGTWTGLETPPRWVHGVALIRGTPPNICLYAAGGCLHLQIGTERHVLDAHGPAVHCARAPTSLWLRRRFWIEGEQGALAYGYTYWAGGGDFFRWLARRAADSAWRERAAREWSSGVEAAALRAAEPA